MVKVVVVALTCGGCDVLVSSRSAGDSGDGDRTGVGVEVCVVPSGSSGEEYHVLLEDGGALRLVLGSCAVDGVPVTAISSPKLAPGEASYLSANVVVWLVEFTNVPLIHRLD